jgi:glutamate-ammonia-ligase adenylyltransferase
MLPHERLRTLVTDRRSLEILEWLAGPLQTAISESASPERALTGFERLLVSMRQSSGILETLASVPHSLDVLATLFAGSQFLTNILLQNPEYIERVTERNGIGQIKTGAQFDAEARAAVSYADSGPFSRSPLDALRRYQRAELLRIGAGDLCGISNLTTVTEQLSLLADSLIRAAAHDVAASLATPLDGFAVLALGKLGGQELNYSSDVDLLFLAERDASAFQRTGERLIGALTESSDEGFMYRVDVRLRPWGRVGPLIPTIGGYMAYLERHARLWEKQALLKARPVAGDMRLARRFLNQIGPLLFEGDPASIRSDVHAMKQLTEAHLREQGRHWGEVKLGEGSIRDVEFVVQYLQLVHGGACPELRTGNTLEALSRLGERGYLPANAHRVLSEGYTFLRTVEHYLQILDYRQTHTLPRAEADLRYLARRLGFEGGDAAATFVLRFEQHADAVRKVYRSYLIVEETANAVEGASAMTHVPLELAEGRPGAGRSEAAIAQHVSRLAPSYAVSFTEAEIAQHAALALSLDEYSPIAVEAARGPGEGLWRVTVVGYDFLGELSLICGLLFAYGFSIIDGQVFTYEPATDAAGSPRKIVDVFTVRETPRRPADAQVWERYAEELSGLVRRLQDSGAKAAQGEIARRVAVALTDVESISPALHPIEIEIDNESSDRYTILRIDTPDTIGFLYEFSNALALNGVHVAYVAVASLGNRVHDTLYVTDVRGQKITSPDRQRELRAATVLVKHFTHLLPRSPNPEAALQHFHEYLGELFSRPDWPDELASLEKPEVLAALARLLGVSEFLWDDFLRMQYANLFPVVADVGALTSAKTKAQLAAELDRELAPEAMAGGSPAEASTPQQQRDALNAFKDREMFRIDMRHIMGQIPEFRQFSTELTDLAEVALDGAVALARRSLVPEFGEPLDEAGQPARFSLVALGKCGGREMGFASDIELMFLFDGSGETSGPRVIGTPEYFEKLVIETVRSVRARREGIFEIDLQLRPYGRAGSLAVSLEAFRRYYSPGGPAWDYERQALVRLRPIAGDAALGEETVALRDAFVYSGEPFNVPAMRAMRERQLRHLVTPGTINAKYSQGGLVDLEYVVQALQITHGAQHRELRVTNTGDAISALWKAGVISEENHARLTEAHNSLEQLINALRVVRGNNKDLTVPPAGSDEFAFLARRLGYDQDPARLSAEMSHHMDWVQKLSTRLLG